MSDAVKQIWDRFQRAVIPAHANEEQTREMQRAFYSGFFSALSWSDRVANGPDEVVAAETIGTAWRECESFFREVIEERRPQ